MAGGVGLSRLEMRCRGCSISCGREMNHEKPVTKNIRGEHHFFGSLLNVRLNVFRLQSSDLLSDVPSRSPTVWGF